MVDSHLLKEGLTAAAESHVVQDIVAEGNAGLHNALDAVRTLTFGGAETKAMAASAEELFSGSGRNLDRLLDNRGPSLVELADSPSRGIPDVLPPGQSVSIVGIAEKSVLRGVPDVSPPGASFSIIGSAEKSVSRGIPDVSLPGESFNIIGSAEKSVSRGVPDVLAPGRSSSIFDLADNSIVDGRFTIPRIADLDAKGGITVFPRGNPDVLSPGHSSNILKLPD